jgi:hypothetical protein
VTGFLSIIWRELAVGARQKATYRARLIAAAIMMTIFMVVLLFSGQNHQFLGPMLFSITFFILYMQALLSGIRLTADCLSEEKREGTLGLLYLSGLRGSGIVLGKMAVRSLRGIYTLIAALPIFGFCILLGGVQGSAALYAGVGILVTMLYSLAIGVFVSSIASDEKAVFAGVLLMIAGLSVVPHLLWWFIRFLNPATTWANYLLLPSPWSSGILDFWEQTLFQIFCSAALISASVWFLNRSFKNQFADLPRSQKSANQFKSRVNGQLDRNPILWLLNLDTFSERIAKAHFLMSLVMVVAVAFVAARATSFNLGPFLVIYVFHLAWKFLVLSDALRRLHHDHRSGALELLLTTRIDPAQILAAQTRRTSRVFLPGAIVLAVANLTFYLHDSFPDDLFLIPIGGAILLFIDGATLRWTAMAQALEPNRFPAAIIRLAAKILFLPLLILWLIMITIRSIGTTELNLFFITWFTACAIYDAALIRRAKRTLQDLRHLASNEPPPTKTTRKPMPQFLHWLLLTDPIDKPNT